MCSSDQDRAIPNIIFCPESATEKWYGYALALVSHDFDVQDYLMRCASLSAGSSVRDRCLDVDNSCGFKLSDHLWMDDVQTRFSIEEDNDIALQGFSKDSGIESTSIVLFL